MDLVNEVVQKTGYIMTCMIWKNYIERHTEVEKCSLQQINRSTQLEVLKPSMISGHP
jgi:predicted PP-loop superfamily ATPase